MYGYAAVEAIFYRLVDQRVGVSLKDPDRYDAVARFDEEFADARERYRNTRSRLFPDVADPPLMMIVPPAEAAGTYFHPGYGNLTLLLNSPPAQDLPVRKGTDYVLHADWEKEFTYSLDFEHVSGTSHVVWVNMKHRTPMLRDGLRAEFVIGANGKVERMGMGIEPALKEMIWFEKL
jgi:hypothetical protein